MLSDPRSAHNVFYRDVVSCIDETVFAVLYKQKGGRPNVSIRTLVGMMILKEGEGWTDEQLFNACQFDLRVMLSLGLSNINDEVPCASTYYGFKVALEKHQAKNGVNLLERCFKKLTLEQMDYHGVSGKQIRLDSKLMQSNIAKNSRLALLLEGLRVHVASKLDQWSGRIEMTTQEQELLKGLQSKRPHRILYQMLDKEQSEMLQLTGELYQKLASKLEKGAVLYELYHQHFKEEKITAEADDKSEAPTAPPGSSTVKPKAHKELQSDGIQSIHDTEANYRKKNNQKVHGYHVQVTETCTEGNDIDLIVDVSTNGAHESESDFLQSTIEQSSKLIGEVDKSEEVRTVIADGGYDSTENRAWAEKKEDMQLVLTNTKGSARRYEMSQDDQGALKVHDTKTNTECEVKACRGNEDKIVVTNGEGKRVYFTRAQVANNIRRQQISEQAEKYHNIRSNVEATIHQMFCKLTRRSKTRYRGKFRCHLYVLSRAIWANYRRIAKKINKKPAKILDILFRALMNRLSTKFYNKNCCCCLVPL